MLLSNSNHRAGFQFKAQWMKDHLQLIARPVQTQNEFNVLSLICGVQLLLDHN